MSRQNQTLINKFKYSLLLQFLPLFCLTILVHPLLVTKLRKEKNVCYYFQKIFYFNH